MSERHIPPDVGSLRAEIVGLLTIADHRWAPMNRDNWIMDALVVLLRAELRRLTDAR